jgi:hypothetical protein
MRRSYGLLKGRQCFIFFYKIPEITEYKEELLFLENGSAPL